MLSKITKCFSIAVLLVAALFWSSVAQFQLEVNLVICGAAVIIAIQAMKAKKYVWGAGFVVIALLFNPAESIFKLPGTLSMALVLLSIVPFAISLAVLKPERRLSLPSITDRNPGSESL